MPLPPFVIPRFNPREIPGLAAWYDAADAASVTLDSGRVSQWSDKSGNARHAANTTSGSTQPSYTTAGRTGLNVLTFAAASVQRLTIAGTGTFNFLHNGTDSLVLAVVKYGTVADPQAAYTLFGNNGGASANVGSFITYDDRVSSAGLNNAINASVTLGSVGQFSFNCFNFDNSVVISAFNNVFTPQVFCVQEMAIDADNATAANRFRLRVNGGAEIAANIKLVSPTTANASFAMQIGTSGNNAAPLQGDVCELMFFNQRPSNEARDLLRRYLGQKWGVTVA